MKKHEEGVKRTKFRHPGGHVPPRLIRLCLLMQICMASLLVGVGMLVYAVNRASYYGLESFAVSNLNTGVIDIL